MDTDSKNKDQFEETNADLFDYSMDDAGDPSLDTTIEELNKSTDKNEAYSKEQTSDQQADGQKHSGHGIDILPTTNEEEISAGASGLQ